MSDQALKQLAYIPVLGVMVLGFICLVNDWEVRRLRREGKIDVSEEFRAFDYWAWPLVIACCVTLVACAIAILAAQLAKFFWGV